MSGLTILCKVVDNFGDIGFVYRLAKSLLRENPSRAIRLVVDGLGAFRKIAPAVNPNLAEQELVFAGGIAERDGAKIVCRPKSAATEIAGAAIKAAAGKRSEEKFSQDQETGDAITVCKNQSGGGENCLQDQDCGLLVEKERRPQNAAQENGGKAKTAVAGERPEEKFSQDQEAARIKVFDWNAADVCRAEWTKNPPSVILECFQCGRPDWLEEILFGGASAENDDATKNDGKAESDGAKIASKPKNAATEIVGATIKAAAKERADEKFSQDKEAGDAITVCKTQNGGGENCLQDQDCGLLAENECKPKNAATKIAGATIKAANTKNDSKPKNAAEKPPPRALAINIDYLTAEPYAEEFHRLKSGTRSASVQKFFFMPGFTKNTGGLVLDAPFFCGRDKRATEIACAATSAPQLECPRETKIGGEKNRPPEILIFSYPKDFVPIFRAILRWNKGARISAAQGAGKESVLLAARSLARTDDCVFACARAAGIVRKPKTTAEIACKAKNAPSQKDDCKNKNDGATKNSRAEKSAFGLDVRELPFLPQEKWDETLCASDILFVRGEDSLSRACLLGKPFVWQAYLQDDDYQLVKVRALLDRMRPHFAADDFAAVERFWLLYNGASGSESGAVQDKADGAEMEAACLAFLSRADGLRAGFESFAQGLYALGNFSEKLDAFIAEKMR